MGGTPTGRDGHISDAVKPETLLATRPDREQACKVIEGPQAELAKLVRISTSVRPGTPEEEDIQERIATVARTITEMVDS